MGRAVERQERAAPPAGKERRMWRVREVSASAVPAGHSQNVCPCALGTCVRVSSPAQQPGPGSAWLTLTLLCVGDPCGSLPLQIPSLADPYPWNRPAASTELGSPGSGKPPELCTRGWGPQQVPAGAGRLEKPPVPTCSSRLIPAVWNALEFGKAVCAMTLGGMCLPLCSQLILVSWEQPSRCPCTGNTQASHGRKFSIGSFQVGAFSLLMVQLPPPWRPVEGVERQCWIWDAQENPLSFQPPLHSLPSTVECPSSTLLSPWNVLGMQSHSSPAGQGSESTHPGLEHPWGHPRWCSCDSVVPTAPWDTQGCWRHPPALPVSQGPSPTGRRDGHLCLSSPPKPSTYLMVFFSLRPRLESGVPTVSREVL